MAAALFAIVAVVFAYAAIVGSGRTAATLELARLSTLDAREISALRGAGRPLWVRVVAPVLDLIRPRVNARWAGISDADLRRAGIDPARFGAVDLVAVKVLTAALCAAVVVALATLLPGIAILIPAVTFAGFIAPSVAVRRRRNARRRQVLRELPDLVGLLKAFVTAGVTLEQALHLISAQQARGGGNNLLAREIRASLGDYGLGVSLDTALLAMAERVGIEELEMLAAALAQGKRQGAAMERILRDQETVVRLAQRNRASAEASRIGTRLVGILVLIYLPEFMVLIMVPLFYGIFLRAFS